MLEVVQGNLLEAQADALVNAVNTEGVMGKGIALQFKMRFPGMYLAYRNACQNGEVQPGRMHVFPLGEGSQPRLIINFPTNGLGYGVMGSYLFILHLSTTNSRQINNR